MNNDLIDRTALLRKWDKKFFSMGGDRLGRNGDEIMWYLNSLLDEIKNAPTVEYPFYQEAYQTGYEEGKNERPQGDIRWTDKLSVKSNGDIIDFEGRVVGHINLEEMKGSVL